QNIVIWDVASVTPIKTLKVGGDVLSLLDVGDGNVWAGVCGTKNEIQIRRLSLKKESERSVGAGVPRRAKKVLTLQQGPAACMLKVKKNFVWIGSYKNILVYDARTNAPYGVTTKGHQAMVHDLVRVGNRVWSCSSDKTIG